MAFKKLNVLIVGPLLFAGILIGGFLVLKTKSGSADFSQQVASFFGLGDQASQDPKQKDSDSDGLTDWQEEIYKTDPQNPDSDGDGYLDGEEILSGYDPLKPAPEDQITDSPQPRPEPGSPKTINLTDELAGSMTDLMRRPASLTGEDLEGQSNDLVNNALAIALAKSPQLRYIPAIEDKDIIISDDISLGAVQNYSAQVNEALAAHLSPDQGIVGLGLEEAIAAVQTHNFSALDKYIKGYRDSYLIIRTIPVPVTWKEIHKKNLAILLGSANIFEAIKAADNDPLRILLALDQYQQVISNALWIIEEAGKLIPN